MRSPHPALRQEAARLTGPLSAEAFARAEAPGPALDACPTVASLLGELSHRPAPEPVGYLTRLAATLLRRDGRAARLRERGPEGARRGTAAPPPDHLGALRWRHITLALPEDLLRAGLAAADGQEEPPDGVLLLHPLLRFDTPTAHLHLHAGGDKPTSASWRQAHRYAIEAPRPQAARAAAIPDRAALLVGLGLERLWWGHLHARHAAPLAACPTCEEALQPLCRLAGGAQQTFAPPEAGPPGDALPDGVALDRRAARAWLERRLDAEARGELPAPGDPAGFFVALLRPADPQLGGIGAVARGVALAARVAAHRAVISQAAGLDAFQAAAAAARALIRGEAAAPAPPDEGPRWSMTLRAEERRVKIATAAELGRQLAAARPSTPDRERGLIWLISRSSTAEEPRDDRSGGPRVGGLLRRVVGRGRAAGPSQHEALRAAAEALPPWVEGADRRSLHLLRGLDLAGNERQGPLWAYGALLRSLRAQLDSAAVAQRLPAPGLTLHAGEDYHHLLTGLRACHEPIDMGLMRPGDRLGHCVALGLEPAAWAKSKPTVDVPRWERVLDLSWALDRLHGLSPTAPQAQRAQRAAWAAELRALLRGYGLSVCDKAARGLHRGICALRIDELQALHDALGDATGAEQPFAQRALAAAARSEGPPVKVRPAAEAPTLALLSRGVRAALADRLIAVEVCPSSNLVVAGLDGVLGQPNFWRRGLDPAQHDALPLCLSADDPLEFATRLEDELAYAMAGLQAGGLAGTFAAGWLRDAMETAYRARFTLPAGAAADAG